MGKEDINYYKMAPTHLYREDGSSKLFNTQKEVDEAWEDGWFGPPWLKKEQSLLSQSKFSSKAELVKAAKSDSRYEGISINENNMKFDDLYEALYEFEQDERNKDRFQ